MSSHNPAETQKRGHRHPTEHSVLCHCGQPRDAEVHQADAPAEPRAGDIYRFCYNAAERERLGFSANHCFEGYLHARELAGGLMLVDTYWGFNGDGRAFTPAEAGKKGTLTFYCNLNDVEPIKDYEQVYYSDADLFTVSEQHACVPRCVHWFTRKGAVRNAEKMLRVISERIANAERKIKYATDDIQQFTEKRQQVEAGNLEVYL